MISRMKIRLYYSLSATASTANRTGKQVFNLPFQPTARNVAQKRNQSRNEGLSRTFRRAFARARWPPLGPKIWYKALVGHTSFAARVSPAQKKRRDTFWLRAKAALRSTGHDRPHLDDFEVASLNLAEGVQRRVFHRGSGGAADVQLNPLRPPSSVLFHAVRITLPDGANC